MKNSVFVDTVAWLALVNKSEDLHGAARIVRDQLIQQKAKLITTDFVVVEIANSLARLPLRGVARKLIDFIRTSDTVELVTISPELFEKAYQLYCSRDDKEWGLTDCTSFVVMEMMRMNRAFTADRHFEQAGFTVLLK
jgi:predicted nucleic acid-binding protein